MPEFARMSARQIIWDGDIIPVQDARFKLGNETLRWLEAHIYEKLMVRGLLAFGRTVFCPFVFESLDNYYKYTSGSGYFIEGVLDAELHTGTTSGSIATLGKFGWLPFSRNIVFDAIYRFNSYTNFQAFVGIGFYIPGDVDDASLITARQTGFKFEADGSQVIIYAFSSNGTDYQKTDTGYRFTSEWVRHRYRVWIKSDKAEFYIGENKVAEHTIFTPSGQISRIGAIIKNLEAADKILNLNFMLVSGVTGEW